MEKHDPFGTENADEMKRLWAIFASTGKVEDYLKYSRAARREHGLVKHGLVEPGEKG